jgi:hypothetical protein
LNGLDESVEMLRLRCAALSMTIVLLLRWYIG